MISKGPVKNDRIKPFGAHFVITGSTDSSNTSPVVTLPPGLRPPAHPIFLHSSCAEGCRRVSIFVLKVVTLPLVPGYAGPAFNLQTPDRSGVVGVAVFWTFSAAAHPKMRTATNAKLAISKYFPIGNSSFRHQNALNEPRCDTNATD